MRDRRGWQAERINRRKNEEEEGQENKERRTSGASHPATQPAMEKEGKKGIPKERKIKAQKQKVVRII